MVDKQWQSSTTGFGSRTGMHGIDGEKDEGKDNGESEGSFRGGEWSFVGPMKPIHQDQVEKVGMRFGFFF